MPGASQGTRCPGHGPRQTAEFSANKPTNWANAAATGACRSPRPRRGPQRRRQRITFSDAALIRERVETAASQLSLRGARRHTLQAAQKLLCGWSRITDDHVALAQVAALIVAGCGRRYDLKTIGRALASLAADELLVYRAAQGRGNRAFLGIHDRFLDGITVLERDESGRVITDYSQRSHRHSVTFSARLPYKNQTHYPPTPRQDSPVPDTRPTEVKVSTEELRQVLAQLPEPLQALPRNLRWMLGARIRARLAAGWRPEQILDKLSRPMPADLQRPWRLAMWRLNHNVPGAGPRLRPLQRAWDQRQLHAERASHDSAMARWYGEVTAVTSPNERAELLRAHEVKFGGITDPMTALATAGQRVTRLFPQMPLAAALTRWSRDILDAPPAKTVEPQSVPETSALSTDLLMDLAISGGSDCVVCGSHRATMRPQLPLKSVVCDQCWPVIAAELSDGQYDDESEVVAA